MWQAIVLGLRGLGRLLDDDAYPAFQARVHALLAPVVAELGDPVDGEDDAAGQAARPARRRVRRPGRRRGDPGPGRRRWFDEAEASPGTVDPELVAAATSIVAATGDDADYDRLLAGYHDGDHARRSSCATSTRSPSSTPRRSCCARASWP